MGTADGYCGWVPRVRAVIVENTAPSAVNPDIVTVLSFKLLTGQNRGLHDSSSAGNFACQ